MRSFGPETLSNLPENSRPEYRPPRLIARELHMSEATVKTHLLHIFAKLNVDDRTAAVTAALERGIVRLDR